MRFFNKINAKILFGCSLLALGSTSCIMDSFDVDEAPSMLPQGKYVIAFHFDQLEPFTRADGEYIDGDHREHEIGEDGNYVMFFNESKVCIDVIPLYGTHEEPNGYIEGTYIARYDVDEEEFEVPKYCMAVLNAGGIGDSFKGQKADYIVENMIEQSTNPLTIGFDAKGRFTMTNTVYAVGKEKQYLFDIPKEVIQDYKEPFDPDKVIHATVERMVAKFNFSTKDVPGSRRDNVPAGLNFSDDCKEIFLADEKDRDLIYFTGFDSDGAPQFKLRKWKVAITGWSMNALAKEEYFFKNVNPDPEHNPPFEWNKPQDLRADWAEDVYYDNKPEDYPWQYRRAVTAPNMSTYEGLGDKNHLVNYSYNDIVGFSRGENGMDRTMYTPENTYDYEKYEEKRNMSQYLGSLAPSDLNVEIKVLDDRTDVLAGTHLIVTARLLTNIKSDGEDYTIEEHLYRDRSSMFYDGEENCFYKLITTFNYDLQSQYAMRYHYYEWTDKDKSLPSDNQSAPGEQMIIMPEGMYSLYYVDNSGNLHELSYQNLINSEGDLGDAANIMKNEKYRYFNKAEVEDGDGKVIVNPERLVIRDTQDPSKEAVFKVYSYKEYQKWLENPTYVMEERRTATSNDLASLIYEWTGAVDHFNQGRMYYFKPVGMHQIGTDAKTKQPIYFCGTVRNNWYQYNLLNINSIGTSIDDPNQPIVPQDVPVNSQIELSVKMIDWHNVDAGINNIR